MNNMFTSSSLPMAFDQTNHDNMINLWASGPVQSGVTLDIHNGLNNAGVNTSYNTLVSAEWTINYI